MVSTPTERERREREKRREKETNRQSALEVSFAYVVSEL